MGGSPVGTFQQGAGNRGGGNGNFNPNNSRYNMELFVSADNLFNNVNYGGYSGNQLSPFFGQPTFLQLQYSQLVILVFNNILWPHVTVATMTLNNG